MPPRGKHLTVRAFGEALEAKLSSFDKQQLKDILLRMGHAVAPSERHGFLDELEISQPRPTVDPTDADHLAAHIDELHRDNNDVSHLGTHLYHLH